VAAADVFQQALSQLDNVVALLAQGRKLDPEQVQPVIEVLPESTAGA